MCCDDDDYDVDSDSCFSLFVCGFFVLLTSFLSLQHELKYDRFIEWDTVDTAIRSVLGGRSLMAASLLLSSVDSHLGHHRRPPDLD